MGCKVSVSIVHPDKNDVTPDEDDTTSDESPTTDYETPKRNPVFLSRYDSVESLVSISSPDSP